MNTSEQSEAKERWRQERRRCEGYLESCNRDMRRVPWLAGLFVLVIPAGLVFGGLGVLLTGSATTALLALAAYLVSGHRKEYETRIRELDRRLSKP
ncbi:MAG: hypothetical protein AAFP04_02040 [Myxococcota bacterium]